MDTVTAPAQAAYEVVVQRQMIDLCRKIGRMQAALDGALRKLEVYVLPAIEDGWRRDEAVKLVEEIKSAIRESEERT